MKLINFMLLIIAIVIISGFILFAPFLSNFIIDCCKILGKHRGTFNSWTGYYGNVFGGCLGGLVGGYIAFIIAKTQIEKQNKNTESDRKERLKKELEIKTLEKFSPSFYTIARNLTYNYLFLNDMFRTFNLYINDKIDLANLRDYLENLKREIVLMPVNKIIEEQTNILNFLLGNRIILNRYENDFFELTSIDLPKSFTQIIKLISIARDLNIDNDKHQFSQLFYEKIQYTNATYLPSMRKLNRMTKYLNEHIQNDFLSDLFGTKLEDNDNKKLEDTLFPDFEFIQTK